ncbi:MAG TPA: hypothetical protein VM598_07840 [Bdellovibrionota bacterium]|nr:hypothetical protein [Bdellovibrionota bacterium]
MKTSLSFIFLSIMLIQLPVARAEDDPLKANREELQKFGESVCYRLGSNSIASFCLQRRNSFLGGQATPAQARDVAALKLDLSQALCNQEGISEGLADNCWKAVVGRFNDERKKAEKEGRTDEFGLAQATARIMNNPADGCSQKKRFIFGYRDVDADCMRERVSNLRAALAATAAPLTGAESSEETADTRGATTVADHGSSTYKSFPCSANTDLGSEIQVAGKSPLGEGARLIAYPNAIAIQTGSKDVRVFTNLATGWHVYKGNREKGDWKRTPDSNPGDLLNDQIQIKYEKNSLVLRHYDRATDKTIVTRVDLPRPGESQQPGIIQNNITITTAGRTTELGRFTSRINSDEDARAAAGERSRIEAIALKSERQREQEKFTESFMARSLLAPASSVNLAPQSDYVRTSCASNATDLAAAAGETPAPASTTLPPGVGGSGTAFRGI